jgi:leucyl aminopeptidase
VDAYLSVPWQNRDCGYACSDHASWTDLGFTSAFTSEPVSNPNMHTPRDVIETLSFLQLLEYTKLAVGYAVEISEPNQ